MGIDLSKAKLYYRDPLLEMGSFSRFFVRLISVAFYIALPLAALLLVFGGQSSGRFLGALLLVFLLDRFAGRKKADRKFDAEFRRRAENGQEFNLADYAAPEAKRIIVRAAEKYFSSGGSLILRILNESLARPDCRWILAKMDIKPQEFDFQLRKKLNDSGPTAKMVAKLEVLAAVESLAIKASVFSGSGEVEAKDLFAAGFFSGDEKLAELMNLFKFEPEDIRAAMIFGEFRRNFLDLKSVPMTLSSFVRHRPVAGHRVMNRAWTARPTPFLDSVSSDLTDLARSERIGFIVGHQKEAEQLINILARPSVNNVLLVGESGSGKETLMMHLAYKIAMDDVPPELFDKRLVMLSISQLAAGGSPSQILERTRRIVDEILTAKNIILYIPDFENLIKTSGGQYMSAADAIMPNLARGDFQVAASVAPQDFKKEIEPKKDLAATFEAVRVEEVSEDEAVRILSYISLVLENQYKVSISFRAIKRAVKIAKRHFREKLLPSSAENLLKETLSYIRNLSDNELNEEDVLAVAQMKVNVPLAEAGEDEAKKLLDLENIIHRDLIDQEEAVRAVARSLREYRAGLSRKGGPIATFLFAGPTGVGKTELSKILAKIQFGSKENMVRFDMSEYQDKQSIFRFIGSPDGQVSGVITEAVRQKPYCLILLDEFEKANPDLLNMFLGLFDDGRLTDNAGRTIDFTNTIIIATSNAHSNLIKEMLESGKPAEEVSVELKKRLTDYFRPELINRFSAVIAFKPLSVDDVRQITILLLRELADSLEKAQGISLRFGDTAMDRLLEIGYSPVFGARPMRNAISENVKSVLAEAILRREISRGQTILIKFNGQNFIAEKMSS